MGGCTIQNPGWHLKLLRFVPRDVMALRSNQQPATQFPSRRGDNFWTGHPTWKHLSKAWQGIGISGLLWSVLGAVERVRSVSMQPMSWDAALVTLRSVICTVLSENLRHANVGAT